MAEILPFQGVYFDEGKAGSASQLISPPYDIISPEEQDQLYHLSDHNFIRLVLGKDEPQDNDDNNRFTRAAQYLQQWLSAGTLAQDSSPCLYRQRIDYTVHGQAKTLYGITALVRLADYEEGVVLPHEKTLAGPKEGLHRLMDATQANLDSVWMMYEDNSGSIQSAVSTADWQSVISDASDTQGVRYSLQRLTDTEAAERICQLFEKETLTIADGHHRYETALARSKQLNQLYPDSRLRPWNFVMATLAWTDDPGLTVLPTHRVLSGLDDAALESVLPNLEDSYNVNAKDASGIDTLLDSMDDSSFIWLHGGNAHVCSPKAAIDQLGAELSQESVLADSLGFDITRLKSDKRIKYVEDADLALQMIVNNQAQAAILLKAIPVRTITRYARERRAMPQKSTYFYPKLASGLVLRLIGEVAPVGR